VIVHIARPLSDRSLDALLRSALDALVEGLVVMRDRDGLRHGVWVQEGYVVGAHVAGRFDPLLEVLVRMGALTRPSHGRCMAELHQTRLHQTCLRQRCLEPHAERPASTRRAGAVARELAGVPTGLVHDALQLQAVERFAALREIAGSTGFDAWFEAGPVPVEERSVRLPLGSLLRRVDRLRTARREQEAEQRADARDEARRSLRTLAKALHPDLHTALDEESQRRLTSELARATAQYHGFGRH